MNQCIVELHNFPELFELRCDGKFEINFTTCHLTTPTLIEKLEKISKIFKRLESAINHQRQFGRRAHDLRYAPDVRNWNSLSNMTRRSIKFICFKFSVFSRFEFLVEMRNSINAFFPSFYEFSSVSRFLRPSMTRQDTQNRLHISRRFRATFESFKVLGKFVDK